MISLVEALGYRCLRYVSQPLGPFHVLVGPNASGKTTFLDVIAFLSRLVSDGLDAAVDERTQSFSDLVWNHGDSGFELAIEALIPEDRRQLLALPSFDTVRYQVALQADPTTQATIISAERAWLKMSEPRAERHPDSFPSFRSPPESLIEPDRDLHFRGLFSKSREGRDNLYPEVPSDAGHLVRAFKLGLRKSTLGGLPEDESLFPVSVWLKRLLTTGIERLELDSRKLRLASPPGQGIGFKADGSNLPWVVAELERSNPVRLGEWIAHLRMALPDLQAVRTVVREDDRHRYLVLLYSGGLEVPSWMASDGTLRLLALTLPAYLDGLRGIYLIEEPENGIHPRAIETMFESLSSVYDAQILMATHSPVILSVANADNVLCFAKNDEGATDIVVGRDHPKLIDWHGQVDLGTLFASGVLS